MNETLLANVLDSLRSDLSHPGLLWQVVILFFCSALGWIIARLLRKWMTDSRLQLGVVRLGVESFARVLSPVLAVTLIAIAMPILAQWQPVSLLRLAVPLMGSFALIRFTFYILRRIFMHGGSAGSFLILFEKSFAVLVWIAVALYITGLWPDVIGYMESTMVPVGRHKESLLSIFQGMVSVVITVVFALWAGAMLEERVMRLDAMHSSLRVVMARLGKAMLILAALLISLSLVGIDLTVLSVFGGALGVGLGLGLQKIASSYISGFVILLERSLSIGDMVTVDKYYGQVTQINARYTIVRALDGIETVIPNEMLVASPVQNYSLTDRVLRMATRVIVAFETDVEPLLVLLEAVTVSIDRVCKDPAPQALLIKFGPDGLELEIGFWIIDPENGQLNLLSEVNRAIWKLLREQKVTVPYPQREVRFINEKVVTVSTVAVPEVAAAA